MSVLDHAIGSFNATSTLTTLDIDFGTLTQGTGTASQNFSIFNRPGTLGANWTAKLDLDSVSSASVPGVFSTTLSPFLNVPSGSSQTYGLSMLTTTTGSFSGTYSLNLSDENLPGATPQSMSLTVRGSVVSPANVVFDVTAGTQTQTTLGYAGITGTSSVTKVGNGTILLDGINTFTGTTGIQQGVLAITSTSGIANSSLIDIAAGASFDVRNVSGGYTVGAGQTIGGSGTVLGSAVFDRGSTISPGMMSGAAAASLMGGQSDGAGLGLDSQNIPVPEPSTLGLVGVGFGVAGLLAARRKRAV
jgi:autotransporter-associated beta strand protein